MCKLIRSRLELSLLIACLAVGCHRGNRGPTASAPFQAGYESILLQSRELASSAFREKRGIHDFAEEESRAIVLLDGRTAWLYFKNMRVPVAGEWTQEMFVSVFIGEDVVFEHFEPFDYDVATLLTYTVKQEAEYMYWRGLGSHIVVSQAHEVAFSEHYMRDKYKYLVALRRPVSRTHLEYLLGVAGFSKRER